MIVTVAVVSGPHAGESFQISLGLSEEQTIGRTRKNAVFFPDAKSVSSRHAVIKNDGGIIVLRDLGSTNGTWVADRRVERWVVKAGESVWFGRTGPCVNFQVQDDLAAGGGVAEFDQQTAAPQALGGPAPSFLDDPRQSAGRFVSAGSPPVAKVPEEQCGLCGSALSQSAFVCYGCRQKLCQAHYDPRAAMCKRCATQAVGSQASPAPPAPAPSVCQACGTTESIAFFTCGACGRYLCLSHHSPATGSCGDCAGF